jgi:beta-glucosidase
MFPHGFLWGAGTAGHQIEGGNTNADTWAMEWDPESPFTEPSGDACDSYHRYGEDIGILADAGLTAYRFSVEWSRVQPEEGHFSRAAMDHYRRVLGTCLESGVTPVVTYQHFTVPRWFAQRGGWSAAGAADLFGAYVERATAHLGDLVPWVCTINEANILCVLMGGPVSAEQRSAHETAATKDMARVLSSGFPYPDVNVMSKAHERAVEAVRSGPGDAKVGWTLALPYYQAIQGGEQRCLEIQRTNQLDWLDVSSRDDFVGVQTYYRRLVGPDGVLPVPKGAPTSMVGWEISPGALEHTVRLAAEHAGVPVLVTENGIATEDDTQRIACIEDALQGLERALDDGVDVRGYLHWSLLDNFEWTSGYRPTFGLVAVDRETFARAPKPSLRWLGEAAGRRRGPGRG